MKSKFFTIRIFVFAALPQFPGETDKDIDDKEVFAEQGHGEYCENES